MSMSVHLSVQKKNIFFSIISSEGALFVEERSQKFVYTLGSG